MSLIFLLLIKVCSMIKKQNIFYKCSNHYIGRQNPMYPSLNQVWLGVNTKCATKYVKNSKIIKKCAYTINWLKDSLVLVNQQTSKLFNLVLQHLISTRNEKTLDCTQCYLKNYVEKYKEMTQKKMWFLNKSMFGKGMKWA